MKNFNPRHHSRLIAFLLICLMAGVGFSAIMVQRTHADKLAASSQAPNENQEDLALGFPVSVTATAGTTGPTGYSTLKAAFDAINAGTHQGAITISILASTTEAAAPDVLNSSGAGSASYTSVLIRPTTDGVTVAGATVTGRGLIELNGADNVTIDGDNPNTGGTNRNLTIQNTAANTVTFTSVIRIALAATVVTSADNDTIKNLNLVGNATGRNIAAATTTTGTENTVFGVLATGGASTVSATTAPAAIASTVTTIGAGATATNLLIDNNSIVTVARAIGVHGAATTVFPGLSISNNTIGNATAGSADQVTSIGITASGPTNGVISGNTVYIEGFIASSTATHAIEVGVVSATGTFTIEKNKVSRVKNNNTQTWPAYGINLGGSNNHVVRNNFVFGLINDQTAGTGAFGTTFGAYGIRAGAGTGHFVYHNSVHMTGAIVGTVSTNLTAAFMIVATTQTGMDVRNNIFSNQITGGNTASPGTRNVAIFLPSGGTAAMNLTLNNNDYFQSADANSRMAQVGVTFGTGEFQAANFNAATTTPATNFRSYSSTLSAAGTNDNASKVVDPLFVSATDLHIAVASPMVDMGASVGVANDIDGQLRVPPPDIGADEPSGTTPPANDIAAGAFISPTNGAVFGAGSSITPQASFTNSGTAPQTSVTVRYKITDSMMVVIYNMTAVIPAINPGQTITVSFPSTSIATPGTYTIMASSELAGDQNAANDSITGTITVLAPVTGSVNVGTGQTFTSLTNPGGIFAALNAAGATGTVTINITSDLTGETGAIALNDVGAAPLGGSAITIKPSGAARTISGTSTALGLIKLNGADNVTIDGSLSGGTDRSLTITNGNTGATVIWIASASAANGANGNTVKNCNLSGNTGATIIAGVLAGSGTTFGGDAETANSNNTMQNCNVFRVQNAAFIRGSGTALDQNWLITGNTFGSAVVADKLQFRGMLIGNAQNFTISNNTIMGISSTAATTSTMTGIQPALLINGGTITRNKISDVKHNNPSGFGSNGIFLTTTSTASNLTISNNFIWDIASVGFAGTLETDNGYGMAIVAGGGYKIYHNSVNLNTNQTAAGSITAAVNITAGVTTAGAIDLRDNALANTETVGTRHAVLSSAPATVFSNINYNDYFAQNVGFIGGSARPTLTDWQTATGQDANSKAVDPLYISPTDLHLQAGSTLINMGTNVGVAVDIDGQPRDATPDIGADEIAASSTFSINDVRTVEGNSGTHTVTFTVSFFSPGAVPPTASVQYATGGGTATPGVDYTAASGTLFFGSLRAPEGGGTTQTRTFTVTIIGDTNKEPNETFFVTLSNPVNGALADSQGAGIIIDEDRAYTSDFDNDNITDLTVFRPSTGIWYTLQSTNNIITYDQFGQMGDIPVPGDYDGDSVTDHAVYRPSIGTWFIEYSSNFNFVVQQWGLSTDKPVQGDYDGDAKTDYAVFRDGTWFVLRSSDSTSQVVSFGTTGDLPVQGDYDGDGKTDFAVFRNGLWFVLKSSTNTLAATSWGLAGDRLVVGDFDGDGSADYTVVRNGTWFILQSLSGTSRVVAWGLGSDIPVAADYDGDGTSDVAVWRPSIGVWYITFSSDGARSPALPPVGKQLGQNGDIPAPAAYVPEHLSGG